MAQDEPIDEPIDGRRARRQRSREAVVSAAFELILEGNGPPSAEEVAERAGVSVSSIFRNFDGLADIQQQALELFGERYSHLLLARPPSGSDLDSRIAFFVRTRLDLYEQANPLMVMARMRSLGDQRWREHVASNRSMLTRQLRACFDPEIDGLTPAGAADLIAVLDSLTSPEAFELMAGAHARTHHQIARAWEAGLLTLIDHCDIWGLTPDVTPSTPKGTR